MQDIGHRFAQSSMTVRPITATVDPPGHQQGRAMPLSPYTTAAMRALALTLAATLALAGAATPAAATKIRMGLPGPMTTFGLPYLVAQKKGWLGDLEVEDIYVTGDSNAMRTVLSGNADNGFRGTLDT